MITPLTRSLSIALALIVLALPHVNAAAPDTQDVIVVFDISGQPGDNAGIEAAMQRFASALPTDARAGVVSANPEAKLLAGLGPPSGIASAIAGLVAVSGSATQKDPAAALERALYELRVAGRPDANQSVVLISDGKIALTQSNIQAEHGGWLRDKLASEAVRRGTRLFVVAWSANADVALAQSLALSTGGEYFRAETADALPEALDRVAAALKVVAPPAAGPDVATTAPVLEADRLAGWVLAAVVAVGVLLSALATAWIVRRQPSRQPATPAAAGQIAENAFLTDVHGLTPISRYVLGTKPVIIG